METLVRGITPLFIAIALIGVAWYAFSEGDPCGEPFAYSIGRVDEEFSIATSTFREVIEEAEMVWENAAGKELFQYDPEASYKVNLIFDERQRDTIVSDKIEQELKDLEGARQETLAEHERLVARHKAMSSDFEELKAAYEAEADRYNADLEALQEKEFVTEEEVEEMERRQAELEEQFEEVEAKRREVNELVAEINAIARRESSIVDEYNTTANTYQELYGTAREFKQGQTALDEINIFQFRQRSDLRLVLVHEFGHVLGIDHVEDPEAVMYRLMEHQSLDPITLTEADVQELEQACQGGSAWPWE